MIDFTSALYLGMQHPRRSLRPWTSFTTGAPAALIEPSGIRRIASRLAALQGLENAILFPSTLHAFWDTFGFFAARGFAFYLDAGAYPIAKWAAESAAAKAALVKSFRHHDEKALNRILLRNAVLDLKPVVVTNGFCPTCGRAAPLEAYLAAIRSRSGFLLIDDTQAIGILGNNSGPDQSYGIGGGGSLIRHHLNSTSVLSVSSLAKGFGVPLAVAAGSRPMIRRLQKSSQTRVHCSPPSIATLRAAEHALNLNRSVGEKLRNRLARQVKRFRKRLTAESLGLTGGLFPVQTLNPVATVDSRRLHHNLRDQGVQTLLHTGHHKNSARISFLLTARHTEEQIDSAAAAVVNAVKYPNYHVISGLKLRKFR